ncbi:recombinase family protein [Streptomyces sp. MUSC 14]|uniref:recombinase family protein n=1 Tax=Streptomyces sp. MUSC 14 TaxID=1354889 RepID=UPI0009A115C8
MTRTDGSVDCVVVRPEFRRLLADLASGVIDGVIFYDLDSLVRQPRDLEDLIDLSSTPNDRSSAPPAAG